MEKVTERQFDEAVANLIESIIRASYKIQDNPERVEKYIREKINNIYIVGKHVGNTALVNELFNP